MLPSCDHEICFQLPLHSLYSFPLFLHNNLFQCHRDNVRMRTRNRFAIVWSGGKGRADGRWIDFRCHFALCAVKFFENSISQHGGCDSLARQVEPRCARFAFEFRHCLGIWASLFVLFDCFEVWMLKSTRKITWPTSSRVGCCRVWQSQTISAHEW